MTLSQFITWTQLGSQTISSSAFSRCYCIYITTSIIDCSVLHPRPLNLSTARKIPRNAASDQKYAALGGTLYSRYGAAFARRAAAATNSRPSTRVITSSVGHPLRIVRRRLHPSPEGPTARHGAVIRNHEMNGLYPPTSRLTPIWTGTPYG